MVVKIASFEGNGRQIYMFNSSKIEVVYFSIVVVQEMHVGGNQGGMRNNYCIAGNFCWTKISPSPGSFVLQKYSME